MAIDIKTFRKMDGQNSSSIKGRIIDFLKRNRVKAFKYKEIAHAINESARSVNANLSLLKEEERVLHKSPYWAYNQSYSPFTKQTHKPSHCSKLLAKILDVSDNIVNRDMPYSLSVKNIAEKYGVAKSTIIDACTRRLQLNTYQFKELVSDKSNLVKFLVDRFPSYESQIREHLKIFQ